MRAHIVVPEEVLQEVDRVAGRRKRSQFVTDAIREKLARAVLTSALDECAGSLDLQEYPEWSTPDEVSAWVRNVRAGDDARLLRKLSTPSA